MKILALFISLSSHAYSYNFTCSSGTAADTLNFAPWNKWPNGIVKYELHSSLSAADRVQVLQAFEVYHQKTCIRFQARSPGEAAYVSIEHDPNTCGVAHVCRTGGYQFAKFGGRCRTSAVMVHELGHTLCYSHEQNREDRDNYLKFPCPSNPPPRKTDGANSLGMFYDYKSSMHYGCDNCMVPTKPGVSPAMCGQEYLSVLDVQKINAFYGCSGCLGYRFHPMSTIPPKDLLPAGFSTNKETLYICRVYQNGDIVPGTGSVKDGACYVGMNGGEYRHSSAPAEILGEGSAGKGRLRWRSGPPNSIPLNAIPGGRTRWGETLYIARARIEVGGREAVIIGKVHSSNPTTALLPFGGTEWKATNYEILICV